MSTSTLELKNTLNTIHQDVPYLVVERTAERLEGMNFDPTLLFPIDNFLHLTKNQMKEEFDRIQSMNRDDLISLGMPKDKDEEDYRGKQLRLMVYWFKLLDNLRRDIPEAWDEINELYEDD